LGKADLGNARSNGQRNSGRAGEFNRKRPCGAASRQKALGIGLWPTPDAVLLLRRAQGNYAPRIDRRRHGTGAIRAGAPLARGEICFPARSEPSVKVGWSFARRSTNKRARRLDVTAQRKTAARPISQAAVS
jgi:hypothetical protein